MSEVSDVSKVSEVSELSEAVKSPFKSPVKSIGWLFGDPLESFDNLWPISSSSTDKSFCPTKQNVIQHWMFCVDKNRDSYQSNKNAIIYEVVDNLMTFWSNKTSIQLR